MARNDSGCCPGPMAMEREVNEVPAKLKEGPGRGSNPGCLAMESEVNPLPKGIKGGGGGRSDRVGGYRGKGETFKERREEHRKG